MSPYSLPELSYDYGALAPHIAGEIMELHHGKHHATYVKGSFDGFRAYFTAAATTIQGSGWALLSWDTLGSRLLVHQLYDHQGQTPPSQIPLVILDMWEHAFYLQYRNVKPDYVKAWWNVVDWADAGARFAAATRGKIAVGG